MNDNGHIAVIDDDYAARDSAARILREAGYQVTEFASGESFLEQDSAQFDCILLDIYMDGLSGLEIMRRIGPTGPNVVLMTGHGTVDVAVAGMKMGAKGFLEKPYVPSELFEEVTQCLGAASAEASPGVHQLDSLTPRQKDVLRGLAAGKPNKVIAHDLGISVRTIEHYRAELMARAGTSSLAQLLRLAMRAGY